MLKYLLMRIKCHANDLYKFDRNFVHVLKSPGKTSSPSPTTTKERCIINLNETYNGHGMVEMDIRLSDVASNVRDHTDNHLEIPLHDNMLERRLEASHICAKIVKTSKPL